MDFILSYSNKELKFIAMTFLVSKSELFWAKNVFLFRSIWFYSNFDKVSLVKIVGPKLVVSKYMKNIQGRNCSSKQDEKEIFIIFLLIQTRLTNDYLAQFFWSNRFHNIFIKLAIV